MICERSSSHKPSNPPKQCSLSRLAGDAQRPFFMKLLAQQPLRAHALDPIDLPANFLVKLDRRREPRHRASVHDRESGH